MRRIVWLLGLSLLLVGCQPTVSVSHAVDLLETPLTHPVLVRKPGGIDPKWRSVLPTDLRHALTVQLSRNEAVVFAQRASTRDPSFYELYRSIDGWHAPSWRLTHPGVPKWIYVFPFGRSQFAIFSTALLHGHGRIYYVVSAYAVDLRGDAASPGSFSFWPGLRLPQNVGHTVYLSDRYTAVRLQYGSSLQPTVAKYSGVTSAGVGPWNGRQVVLQVTDGQRGRLVARAIEGDYAASQRGDVCSIEVPAGSSVAFRPSPDSPSLASSFRVYTPKNAPSPLASVTIGSTWQEETGDLQPGVYQYLLQYAPPTFKPSIPLLVSIRVQ